MVVYEALLPVAGGWMAVGIPEYRLPKNVLNAEIKVIQDLVSVLRIKIILSVLCI